jgi:hypothetical protein
MNVLHVNVDADPAAWIIQLRKPAAQASPQIPPMTKKLNRCRLTSCRPFVSGAICVAMVSSRPSPGHIARPARLSLVCRSPYCSGPPAERLCLRRTLAPRSSRFTLDRLTP